MPTDEPTKPVQEVRRTGSRYIDLMRNAYGKNPTSRHRLAEDFNDAGRELWIAGQVDPFYHDWSWASRENVQADIKAGLEFFRLPDDFGTIINIQEETRTVGSVQVTTMSRLLELRTDTTVSPLTIWVAFDVGRDQLSPDLGPGKFAAIYPVQTADRTDIRLSYTTTWNDYQIKSDGTLEDGKRVPNIPKEWERLLMLTAIIKAFETGDGVAPEGHVTAYANELNRLVTFDAGKQVNYGRPAHSVKDAARGQRGFQYPHTSITRV